MRRTSLSKRAALAALIAGYLAVASAALADDQAGVKRSSSTATTGKGPAPVANNRGVTSGGGTKSAPALETNTPDIHTIVTGSTVKTAPTPTPTPKQTNANPHVFDGQGIDGTAYGTRTSPKSKSTPSPAKGKTAIQEKGIGDLHALPSKGTTATGSALSGMGSLSIPVVVINRTSLALSTNPYDLLHYYYSMSSTCQHSGLPPQTDHYGIPAGQHGGLSNIVTGSTCSVLEPPPPVPHGNSGCKLSPPVWQTTYSMQPVLITAGHTSTITVTNTLLCSSDVSQRVHGQQQ
jgi:hypothetical protein